MRPRWPKRASAPPAGSPVGAPLRRQRAVAAFTRAAAMDASASLTPSRGKRGPEPCPRPPRAGKRPPRRLRDPVPVRRRMGPNTCSGPGSPSRPRPGDGPQPARAGAPRSAAPARNPGVPYPSGGRVIASWAILRGRFRGVGPIGDHPREKPARIAPNAIGGPGRPDTVAGGLDVAGAPPIRQPRGESASGRGGLRSRCRG